MIVEVDDETSEYGVTVTREQWVSVLRHKSTHEDMPESLWRDGWRTALGQSRRSILAMLDLRDTGAGVEWSGLCQVVTRQSGWLQRLAMTGSCS